MNPICEARQETFVAHAGDVHTDTGMGDCLFGAEPVRQPDAGVQSDRLPHHLDPIVRHAVPAQEARRGVGTLDLFHDEDITYAQRLREAAGPPSRSR